MWAVSTVSVVVSVATAWSGESDLLPILVLNLAALSLATAAAGWLRDEIDMGQLEAEINSTVARTVQPAAVSLWLRR